jgi:hypothetical protein
MRQVYGASGIKHSGVSGIQGVFPVSVPIENCSVFSRFFGKDMEGFSIRFHCSSGFEKNGTEHGSRGGHNKVGKRTVVFVKSNRVVLRGRRAAGVGEQ